MTKEEVEQILIIVKSGQSEALNMKIYKNGIICRHGCGGIPQIGISGMSFTDNSETFDKLMEVVPQQILDNPTNYQDEKINIPLEYIIAFYGVSSNGETGEDAEWTKSTGIRLLIDTKTAFRHPILSFSDTFSMDAMEKTNSLYFDVIINAVYKFKATTLPPQTMIALPKTHKEIQKDFENYINQMSNSPRKWDLIALSKDKIYSDGNERQFLPNITKIGDAYSFQFIPVDGQLPDQNVATETPKKWWKLW
jgi:hypothetical protein